MEPVTMSAILTDVGSFFTQAVTWMGDIIGEIVSQPLLLIFCVAIPLTGLAIGYVNRLINVG